MSLLQRLLAWLRASLFGGVRRRNIATLASGGDSAAADTSELVSRTPGPLKPGHRRMTHRDERLLPKPKLGRPVYPRPKRPRYLERQQARRLFAKTLRTRDRNLRDLACDPAQLERYGLPRWETEAELAVALGLTLGELQHFSIHRERETSPHYIAFAIPKRGGGQRVIHAPKRRLKAIQRKLHALLVSRLPVSTHAHGFVAGRSVATNATPHVGKAVVLKLDIENCFPSIHYGRVRGLLIALGYSYPVATALAVLMTEPPRQPVQAEGKLYHVPVGPRVCVQGAPTSPGLCNAVLMRLDRRLFGLAHKHGFAYTRYADDLTFSGDDPGAVAMLLAVVPRIVFQEGFTLNREKTRVLRAAGRQRVAGVVVNQTQGLSRTERRRLRAALHRAAAHGLPAPERQQLRGLLAYLHMLNPEQAAPLLERFAALPK